MDVVYRFWVMPLALVSVLFLEGCASNKATSPDLAVPESTATAAPPTVAPIATSASDQQALSSTQPASDLRDSRDPWETYNRGMFKFNDTLDRWILKPVAIGYRYVAPTPVERGVNNFFSNLREMNTAVNNMLQWKWSKAGNSSGRFLVNTTIGIVGLFDVAKHTGLKRQDSESFGQTLSYWGVGAGPYFVLPFLGPSTVTDAVAIPVDWNINPISYVDALDSYALGFVTMDLISTRANMLDLEKLMTGDKYVFIREAYLQRREYLVNDGEVIDDFSDFDDFDEDF